MLGESLYWFTQQEYAGEKVLFIVNDNDTITLRCDVPGVVIINCQKRFPSLGAKYNFMLDAADGDVFFPWEDDDVSLVHRITQAVTMLDVDDAVYWNPKQAFFQNGLTGKLEYCSPHSVHHNASAFRKTALRYPDDCRQDAGFDSLLRDSTKTVSGCSYMPSYVYRWQSNGDTFGNLSGYSFPDMAYKHLMADYGGVTFDIIPTRKRDYQSEGFTLWATIRH